MPPHQGSLSVVDLGCAHGKQSMSVIKQLFDELKTQPNYIQNLNQLNIYHEDLPDNDFKAVEKSINDPEVGYLTHDLVKQNSIKVNYSFIGKSFYEEILPNNSLDLAFCYNSLHFLPEYKSTQFGIAYTPEYGDEVLTKWFNDTANSYFAKFLTSRYYELKAGGLLSINIPTDSNFQNWVNSNWKKVFENRGLNYRDFDKVVFPVYYRPLDQVNKVLSEFSQKFKLIRSFTVSNQSMVNPNITEAQKQNMKNHFKAVIYNQIASGLEHYPDTFKDEEARDKLYSELEDLCFNDPNPRENKSSFEWLVLQKI